MLKQTPTRILVQALKEQPLPFGMAPKNTEHLRQLIAHRMKTPTILFTDLFVDVLLDQVDWEYVYFKVYAEQLAPDETKPLMIDQDLLDDVQMCLGGLCDAVFSNGVVQDDFTLDSTEVHDIVYRFTQAIQKEESDDWFKRA